MLEKNQSMEPTQQPPQQEQIQSAVAYYNKNRKRSFLFSRITVVFSMFILVVALGINIFSFYSQDTQTTQTHASTPENQKKLLPSLPAGCGYKEIKGGMTVVCPSAQPTVASVTINVVLPQLPHQCGYETSTRGNIIHCTDSTTPIPTVPVTLPATCVATNQHYVVICKSDKENELVPLPSLPGGCSYALVQNNYYVVCKSNN